jgi:cell division protein FtsZ
MDASLENTPGTQPSAQTPVIRIFGVGTAGVSVVDQLIAGGLPATACAAVNTEAHFLAGSAASEKVQLETKPLPGLGTGGDPDRGRAVAEEHVARLKSLCQGVEVVFIVAGLGGGAGTGVGPVLARAAKESGALVLGFVTLPFECEGSRRRRLAQRGLDDLKEVADGVICLPNQKVFKLLDETTSVLQAFQLTNQLLAGGVRGLWRLLKHPGLIELHFGDVRELVRDRHSESVFATAEAVGPTRSKDVLDKLLAHPLLDGGELLRDADAVLVSLMGGPDLTMTEVHRVMEQINSQCAQAQVLVGAAIDESFRERLAVTVIAARQAVEDAERVEAQGPQRRDTEGLDVQLLAGEATGRPGSRFVPPAPILPPEQMRQMLARQRAAGSRGRKATPRLRQGQLPLEIISKGRFDKSEPTIHKGEDLDVPTYIRRGVSLN